jgi:serine/threonine protein kinase
MTFSLSSQNIFDYLSDLGLCADSDREETQIEPKAAKNFNLLLSFPDRQKLLVKQERINPTGKRAGEFLREWRFHKLLAQFSKLYHLRSLTSEVIHFNEQDSIIAFNYLDNYRDLADFYLKDKSFPTEIASATGIALASIHRATFNRQEYRDFINEYCDDRLLDLPSYNMRSLNRLSPEIFGQVPADAIKFFVLYQRYDSLDAAISELIATAKPCCIIHNDLKLSNILLDLNWDRDSNPVDISGNSNHSIVRAIDWERSTWGDPAFDLGALIASYLHLWLSSLVVSKSMAIEESLRLATTSLEQLQPSIAAFTEAYLTHFPELIEHHPDLLKRIIQFAGLSLIEQIQATIQYQKTFGNAGISTLQVAKSLLCRPEQSVPTIFGEAASKLSHLFCVAA